MTYVSIYSLNGQEPAALPPSVLPEDAAGLGYVLAAPKPNTIDSEEIFWNVTHWAARPVEMPTAEQPQNGEQS